MGRYLHMLPMMGSPLGPGMLLKGSTMEDKDVTADMIEIQEITSQFIFLFKDSRPLRKHLVFLEKTLGFSGENT